MGKKAHCSDNHLLRLEAKFFVRSDEWDEATATTAKIEETFDRLLSRLEKRRRSRVHKTEREEEGRAAAVSRLFFKIMKTRANGLAGILAKVRVYERWNADDEDSEGTFFKSLMKDIKAMEARP
ncbi:hypothetical protein ASD64_11475 [Mesorhizobium sp. Root157]|uniref:hypothetical protein n=1 Tax=Mesorhizobium sp. Root157 TaxID=1736477 RepID=UPI000701BE96|nr:hypothetical protein [Mesorhizobium sp. Root157]KQZ80903.1 hypothetical protein ASD64_11475 [Mesorhizobium sp. Root157]